MFPVIDSPKLEPCRNRVFPGREFKNTCREYPLLAALPQRDEIASSRFQYSFTLNSSYTPQLSNSWSREDVKIVILGFLLSQVDSVM